MCIPFIPAGFAGSVKGPVLTIICEFALSTVMRICVSASPLVESAKERVVATPDAVSAIVRADGACIGVAAAMYAAAAAASKGESKSITWPLDLSDVPFL
jgi:hypothetical protein